MSSENKVTAEEETTSVSLGPRTAGEVWKDWGVASVKYTWKKIHNPFVVYLLSTWFVSFIIMGITNTFRPQR